MLPATARVRRRADFTTALRGGRVRSGALVLHYGSQASGPGARETARAGVIVSRAVGGAVVRNRVRRRIRHLLRPLMAGLPDGSVLLVRALPAAAGRSSAELGAALASARSRMLRVDQPDT